MKLLIFAVFLFLITLAFGADADTYEAEEAGSSNMFKMISYTEEDFKENTRRKAHFVMFYAPW